MQRRILITIVISQFACVSVWFAINAVMPELVTLFRLSENSVNTFTSVIQFGFIAGTLLLATLGIVDKFKASTIFMICGLLAAVSNLALLNTNNTLISISILRFITGISLAGVYPVGIKIASDYFKNGLGKALGYLVGMLVLGTAIPHFFNFIALSNSFRDVILITSGLSALGALLVGFSIADGPYKSTQKMVFTPKKTLQLFKNKGFKKASFGYFGHMWELYTFWTFVPAFLGTYNKLNNVTIDISLWSFIIIGVGALSSIYGGYLTQKFTSQWIAKNSLLGSLLCIIIFPFSLYFPLSLFLIFLLIWGMLVIADSAQLSTLVAQSAPLVYKGTAITLVNCIGFGLTIVSIQLTGYLYTIYNSSYIYWIMGIGPLIGFYYLRNRKKQVPLYLH